MGWDYYTRDSDYDNLRHVFPGVESITRNYSQAFQDMFVLSVLNGKRNGVYVEIGGCTPIDINNTYLLENQFGWRGISLEISASRVGKYNGIRKNKAICTDALKVDYDKLFSERDFPAQIDYLSLDIDPAKQTLKCLKLLPLNKYRFSVITYETDAWRDQTGAREESRQILSQNGYELIAGNVRNGPTNPFEDWYIDPSVVDSSVANVFRSEDRAAKKILLSGGL